MSHRYLKDQDIMSWEATYGDADAKGMIDHSHRIPICLLLNARAVILIVSVHVLFLSPSSAVSLSCYSHTVTQSRFLTGGRCDILRAYAAIGQRGVKYVVL